MRNAYFTGRIAKTRKNNITSNKKLYNFADDFTITFQLYIIRDCSPVFHYKCIILREKKKKKKKNLTKSLTFSFEGRIWKKT